MTDYPTIPAAIQPPPRFDPVEQAARAFSLMISPDDARLLVQQAAETTGGEDRLDLFRHASRRAIAQHRLARWLERIRWRNGDQYADAPLGPTTGVSSRDAAALSLHLGAGLDLDELSDVLSISPVQAAISLARARLTLLPEIRPCSQAHVRLLGVTKESHLDLHERHERRAHLRDCPTCRRVSEQFELLETRLLEVLSNYSAPATSPTVKPSRSTRSHWLAPLAATAISLTVCLVVGGLIIGGDRVLGGDSSPIPIVDPHVPGDLEGWLVSSTIDGIGARNLATGEHRMLVTAEMHQSEPPVIMMSPSGKRVAIWRFQDSNQITNSVDVLSLDGETMQTWRWDRTSSPGQITSWLNDDELLFIQAPGIGSDESTDAYVDRQTRENQLLAIDALSGDRRSLFTGSVAMAVPSPNQAYMAILGVYNPDSAEFPGRTLEIRRFEDGGLGEPIVVAKDRYPLETTRPIWSADSSAIFFPRLDDDARGQPRELSRDQRIDIAMMTVDRETRVLTNNQEHERLRLMGVAPDLSRYLYLRSNPGPGPVTWDLYQAPITGEEPAVVAREIGYPHFFSATATWSEDGSIAIVNDSQTHLIHGQSASSTAKAGGTRFLAVYSDNSVRELTTEPGIWGIDAWGIHLLRWYPPGKIESALEVGSQAVRGIFSAPEVIDDGGRNRHTTAYSAISPDGGYALFEHTSTGVPFVWNIKTGAGRLLAGSNAPQDTSWGATDRSLIGVGTSDDGSRSEIKLFASQTSRFADYFDYRSADPLQLGENPDESYELPTFSPDGVYLAYFLRSDSEGSADLWVAGKETGHHKVLEWITPADRKVDQPPIIVWTSEDTFLVAVPDEWISGYPTRISLMQVRLTEEDNLIDVSERHHWAVSGRDNGVVIESIDFSPDGELVAFRERVFTRNDPDRGRRDLIVVASVHDVQQSVTLARGEPGFGLTWSPDGEWISYGIDNEIVVSRRDGSDSRWLSETGNNGRYPLWHPDGTLYFTIGTEHAPQLVRIAIH